MKGLHFLVVGREKLGAFTQKDQAPIVKNPDAGAKQQGFPDIMGDEQSRLVEPISQVEELLLQFHTGHWIKRAKGFVQQQQRRICCECAGDPHPLTLAAGQIAGIACGELRRRKSDLSQEIVHTGIDVDGLPTLQTRNQSDIGGHSEMRKEARILDHVPDPTPQSDQIPGGRGYPLDQDITGTWQEQAIHHFQGGRLARPTPTQEHQSFSGFDIETEIVQNIFLTDAGRNLSEGDKWTHVSIIHMTLKYS